MNLLIGFFLLREILGARKKGHRSVPWAKDSGHGRRWREFHDAGRKAGLTYRQRDDELFINETIAHFRRIASDGVGRSPDGTLWLDQINSAKQRSFEKIAEERPELLDRFDARIRDLSYGDILYPEEASAVDRLYVNSLPKSAATEDQIAALRLVRPG